MRKELHTKDTLSLFIIAVAKSQQKTQAVEENKLIGEQIVQERKIE
jgi:hypothetical protein